MFVNSEPFQVVIGNPNSKDTILDFKAFPQGPGTLFTI